MALLFVVLGLAAAIVYRPWHALPFDIWDFREFIPLLKASSGPWNQFNALVEYYLTHGRANLLFYASFVVQWQLFGLDPSGWQWWRFGLMLIVLLLSMVLLWRLGATALGAAAGTVLLVASSSVQRGWVQLMAEPQALALLLVAGLLALDYQQVNRWGRRVVLIAVLLLGVFLSKEVVGVLGGFVVVLATCRGPDGAWRPPLWNRRDYVLVGLAAGVVVLIGGLLLYVRALPEAEGYGMSYGAGNMDLDRLAGNFLRAALPHHAAADLRLGLMYPSNVLFFLVVALGVHQRLRSATSDQGRLLFGVAAMLSMPLVGAVVYWPWPKWDTFYGLPFFFGSGLLLSFTVSALDRASTAHRVAAQIAVAGILFYGALVAQRGLNISEAILRLNVQLAHEMVAFGPHATVVVAGPDEVSRQLPASGIEIKEYAAAMGFADLRKLPRVLEAPCEAVTSLIGGGAGSLVLVSYSYGCGLLPRAASGFRREIRYRDWVTLARRSGVLGVDLLPVVPGSPW